MMMKSSQVWYNGLDFAGLGYLERDIGRPLAELLFEPNLYY